MNGVTAAKQAGVPHIVVLSVSTANRTTTVFGAQFYEIEEMVKESGIPYTIMRLPLFTDNLWYVTESLQ
jgi:uncharacterized protein YbjT (DUF2867 family)